MSPGTSNDSAHGTSNDGAEGPLMATHSALSFGSPRRHLMTSNLKTIEKEHLKGRSKLCFRKFVLVSNEMFTYLYTYWGRKPFSGPTLSRPNVYEGFYLVWFKASSIMNYSSSNSIFIRILFIFYLLIFADPFRAFFSSDAFLPCDFIFRSSFLSFSSSPMVFFSFSSCSMVFL